MTDNAHSQQDELFHMMLSDFLDESRRLLERLNENLLVLDELTAALDDDQPPPYDLDLLNEMFRAAHSLKGLSAMLGLRQINNLTHRVESVFDTARQNQLAIRPGVVEVVFQAVDHLGAMVESLGDESLAGVDASASLAAIESLLESSGAARPQADQSDAEAALCEPSPVAAEPAEPVPAPAAAPTPPVDHFAELHDEGDIPPKYLAMFIDETEASLDTITETLLSWESGRSPAALESLLITSHRIKGSAASIGLKRAAKLAHFMEDLLQDLRGRQGTLSSETVDAMLHAADGLRSYADSLRQGSGATEHFNALYQELVAARAGTPPSAAAPAAAAPAVVAVAGGGSGSAPRADLSQAAPLGTRGFVGSVSFQPGLPLVGLKARLVYEKLVLAGQVFACDPPAEQLEEVEELARLQFGLASDQRADDLRRQLNVAGVVAVELEPYNRELVAAEPPPPTAAATAPPPPRAAAEIGEEKEPAARPAHNGAKPAETLRVDIERLDQLMNLAGQLVINKARFTQIGEGLKHLVTGNQTARLLGNVAERLGKLAGDEGPPASRGATAADWETMRLDAQRMQNDLRQVLRDVTRLAEARGSINELFEAVHQLGRVSDGIQKAVMDTRMVPIGPLFGRFRRVVRDITRANHKEIALVIRGEKTELDKRMIDELADPLIHMVRNSADHGIELPEERLAAGKPRQGTITLDAFHRGNSIVIQVSDDGRGLDPDRIRRKAIERNLIAAADAERLSLPQVFQLIWEPGFSTAEQVTEISGRGMGMDIVRSKIENLSGTVELSSRPGAGTSLAIKLPLTLAILPSLLAEIDGDVFALPIESVNEIVSVAPGDVNTVLGVKTARVRGRVVSLVELSRLIAWNTAPVRRTSLDGARTTLVIISNEGTELGLVVDRLLGEQDIVIKSLAENYRNLHGVAGASILGDGRVSLILDTAALIDLAARPTPSSPVQETVHEPALV